MYIQYGEPINLNIPNLNEKRNLNFCNTMELLKFWNIKLSGTTQSVTLLPLRSGFVSDVPCVGSRADMPGKKRWSVRFIPPVPMETEGMVNTEDWVARGDCVVVADSITS